MDLAHDQRDTSNQTIAAQMLGNISLVIGQQFCERFLSREIFSLGIDPNEKVREVVINQLGNLCIASS
jgi:hypothetical protein